MVTIIAKGDDSGLFDFEELRLFLPFFLENHRHSITGEQSIKFNPVFVTGVDGTLYRPIASFAIHVYRLTSGAVRLKVIPCQVNVIRVL